MADEKDTKKLDDAPDALDLDIAEPVAANGYPAPGRTRGRLAANSAPAHVAASLPEPFKGNRFLTPDEATAWKKAVAEANAANSPKESADV